MARKNVLAPQLIADNQSLAASFESTPTMVTNTDNIAYQINVSTSDSEGSFSIQGSVDYQPATANTPAVAGNWSDLGLGGGIPSVDAQDDTLLFNLSMVPFNALRVKYTSTVAGTGTCDIYVMTKQVGG